MKKLQPESTLFRSIVQATCDVFGINIKDIDKKTKKQPLPTARKTIMVIGLAYGLSSRFLARHLRVHVSIVSRADKEDTIKASDIEYKARFEAIKNKLTPN